MKGTEYFVSLQTRFVLTQQFNLMANNGELTGTTEYQTLSMRCRIKRCHFNRVLLYLNLNKNDSARSQVFYNNV